MSKRLTLEEFIERAKKVHGDKYDYSKVKYVNNYTKVCIICPKHDEFWQTPKKHLNGQGCPKCARNQKLTFDEIVERARVVHHNFYQYKRVNIQNLHDKINIICPIHGEFYQEAANHLNGQGCPKCNNHNVLTEKQINAYSEKLNRHGEHFFERVKKYFKNKYIYNEKEYKGNNYEIEIICPIHGKFTMTPQQHLKGHNCPKCAIEKKNKKIKEFIKEANIVHNNKYIYTKCQLNGMHNLSCIICPIHGEFWQSPSAHLSGQGCPKCKSSKLENEIRIFLQDNKIEFEEQKKFDWLGKQSLDFYLPHINIGIECQGIQHFKINGHFGGLNEFMKIQVRDKNKRKLCEENNIKLLYYSNLGIEYPYKVYEDKDELLKEILT